MAENLDININASGNATQVLRNLDKQLNSVNDKFAVMRRLLGGLAIGSFISNTLRFADGIQDLSNATGIATANILGFSQAVQANGGSIEGAQNALNKFVLTIGEAADGSKSAQDAFSQVGVTLQDLRTLSEQDLLQKVVTGLAGITDNAKRATLQNELLGKSLRGVDLRGVAAGYGAAVAAAGPYSASIKAAADAQDSLERNLNNLRAAVLQLIAPINNLVAGINISAEAFKNLIAGILSAYAAFKLLKIIANKDLGNNIVAGFKLLPTLLMMITSGTGSLLKEITKLGELKKIYNIWSRIIEGAKNAASVIGGLGGTVAILVRVVGRLAGIFGVLYSALQAVKFINEATFNVKWIKDFTDYVDKLIGKIPLLGQYLGTVEQNLDPFKRGPSTRGGAALRKQLREVAEARQKDIDKIKQQGVAQSDQFKQLVDNIKQEQKYIKLGEQRAEVERNLYEVTRLAADARKQLEEQIAGLDPKKDQDIIKALQGRIAQINALEKATTKEIATETQGLQQLRSEIELTATRNRIALEQYQDQLTNNEVIQQLRDEASLIGLTGKELKIRTEKMRIDQTVRQAVTTELVKQKDILNQINDANARGNTIEAQRLKLELEASKARVDGIKKAGEEQKKQTEENINQDTQYNESVFDRIANRIKDTQEELKKYNLGDSIFSNLMQAIDTFVQTGKFKFKEFAGAVLKEWLAVKAKMAIMDVLDSGLKKLKDIFGAFGGGGGSSGGGFFSSFFGNLLKSFLPGFANGGMPPVGKASIVGERGPELFVPRSAGTVVPNHMLGTGSVNAPVTNNYITNNISALDAKSVAQLFAENRKALLGSVRVAEKELPYRA